MNKQRGKITRKRQENASCFCAICVLRAVSTLNRSLLVYSLPNDRSVHPVSVLFLPNNACLSPFPFEPPLYFPTTLSVHPVSVQMVLTWSQ